MKIFTFIINFLTNICYVLIGIVVLVALPIVFGCKPVVVLSGSMEPTYKVGSIIYYRKVAKEEIKENDVISYYLEDDLVTHRLIRVEDDLYYTKGDANNVIDAKSISYENIQGKVTKIYIPYLGYLLKTLTTNWYLIGIAAIILITDFIVINFGNKKKDVKC